MKKPVTEPQPTPAEQAGGTSPATSVQEPAQPVEIHKLSAEEIEELKSRAAKADEHWDPMVKP